MSLIYLDYNATTPIDPEVVAAMKPYLENQFGNPSSNHVFGAEARMAIEKARAQVAALINCHPSELVFTSGGTESNNMAIKGMALALKHQGNHIITTAIEHPAISEVCAWLATNGFKVTIIPVDSYGMVSPSDIEKAITPATILITVMHANNEVGTIQPLAAIGALARTHKLVFHSDAAQSAGKIPIDVAAMNLDMLSLAGHKLYAPKGIGALYLKQGLKPEKLIHGADHEFNLRAGTENVAQIVALGKACEIAKRDMDFTPKRAQMLRDQLYSRIKDGFSSAYLNGHPELRLPNTLSISFAGIEANTLLSELTTVAASAGAACHAGDVKLSKVLEAMHVPVEQAMGTIRFSTGKFLSEAEIDRAADEILGAVHKLANHQSVVVQENAETIRLTQFTHGLGCACKLRPQVLEEVLKNLPAFPHKNILVGTETSDDAAVYRLTDDMALVQTLDFFTPVVDDPYTFGAIAAANALSDIYAMGAKPLFALNIAAFPSQRLPTWVLHQILKGAADKAAEAGIPTMGGHTVDDNEPKFGLAVTGIVHPQHIWRNQGAKVGDKLILTKPLGTGIVSTALKRGMASKSQQQQASDCMAQLNRVAAEVGGRFTVNACTDITGFGLLGHVKEMAEASGCTFRINSKELPLIEGVVDLVLAGSVPGGTQNNLEFVSNAVAFKEDVPNYLRLICADAQTSGGLLFCVPEPEAKEMLKQLHLAGIHQASCIGKVMSKEERFIKVV